MSGYRPLPDGLCVRYNDTTREHGLYALQDFEVGHDFGFARIESTLKNGDLSAGISRSPMSAFVNCDDQNPSCEMSKVLIAHERHWVNLISIRPISAGDELTVSYTLTQYGTPKNRPWD